MKIILTRKDFKKDTFRSGGSGGQNVNKVSSGVRWTHLETGLSVSCTETPCQHQNSRKALRLLAERLLEHYMEMGRVEHSKPPSSFSSQVRTYRLDGQKGIVDHRSKSYTRQVEDFLNGGTPLDEFMRDILRMEIE